MFIVVKKFFYIYISNLVYSAQSVYLYIYSFANKSTYTLKNLNEGENQV